MANPVLWQPSPAEQASSRLAAFLRYVREERGVAVADGDYFALHRWSVEDLAGFWEAFAAFSKVRFATPAPGAPGIAREPSAPGAGVANRTFENAANASQKPARSSTDQRCNAK